MSELTPENLKWLVDRGWLSEREAYPVIRKVISKALRIGTKVLMSSGEWKPVEEITRGSMVFDRLGNLTLVTSVRPLGEREILQVTFADGSAVDADADHLWATWQRKRYQIETWWGAIQMRERASREKVATTREIMEAIALRPDHPAYKWRTPAAPVLQMGRSEESLPIEPYTFGVIIGGGYLRGGYPTITMRDDLDILPLLECKVSAQWNGRTYGLLGMKEILLSMGLFGLRSREKFIPATYLYNEEGIRRGVLAGILDTGGKMVRNGGIEWSSSSSLLADNMEWLVRSLGGTVSRKVRQIGSSESESHRLYIRLPDNPFRCRRKKEEWLSPTHTMDRIIESIRPIGNKDQVVAVSIGNGNRRDCLIVEDHIVA